MTSQVPSSRRRSIAGGFERDAGRRRGVVRLRVRILDPSGQAEHEPVLGREPAEAVAEIEDDPVLLGVADPAGALPEVVGRAAIPVPEGLGQVAAVEVASARTGSTCVRQAISSPVGRGPSGANRSSGVDETPGGRSTTSSSDVVEISDLVHRLGDREPEDAVDRPELVAGDRDGLVAVGLAVDPRGDQVAEAAAAQEVAEADESLAVPREKDRATARLAVVLGQVELLVGRRRSARTA